MNLGAIQKAVDAGKLSADGTIDHAALKAAGLARGGKDGVRLLAKGAFSAKLSFLVAGVLGRCAQRRRGSGRFGRSADRRAGRREGRRQEGREVSRAPGAQGVVQGLIR